MCLLSKFNGFGHVVFMNLPTVGQLKKEILGAFGAT